MEKIKFNVDFYHGCRVEIVGETNKEYFENDTYHVQFFNEKTGHLIHSTDLLPNHWTKPHIKYFVPWRVIIKKNNTIVHNEVLILKDKKILISIDNTPLGDNISWIPYIKEFERIHSCDVILQTYFNDLYAEYYPSLKCVQQGTYDVNHCSEFYASYRISYGTSQEDFNKHYKELIKHKNWDYVPNISFWDSYESPVHPNHVPLQEYITKVLGIEHKEIRPVFKKTNNSKPFNEKYVCISEFASGIEKEWRNPIGWQTLVDELNSLGFKVVSISKEKSKLKNIVKRNGNLPLSERIWYLQNCEFFIGVSSGLSWLAWACDCKVVLISGITNKNNEFNENCIRIINESVCNGCWNISEHSDKFVCRKTLFCPENKNFICSRSISPKMVIEKIKSELILT